MQRAWTAGTLTAALRAVVMAVAVCANGMALAAPAAVATFSFLATFAVPAAAAATDRSPSALDASPAPACGDEVTQAAMNRCGHDDFLAAGAVLAAQVTALRGTVPAAQRQRLQRMQEAWTGWRTAACRFEAGPVAGGSLHDFIYWTCAARMTRERAAQLSADLAARRDCVEGDVTCSQRR